MHLKTKPSLLRQLTRETDCRDAWLGFRLADPYRTTPTTTKVPAEAPSPTTVMTSLSDFEAPTAPPIVQQSEWVCKGCGTTDTTQLVSNCDNSLVCDVCGTVEGVGIVARDRQKNCTREEDKTVVADVHADGANAAPNTANGVESAYEARKRHIHDAEGTLVPRRVSQKNGLAAAQARVTTAILQDAREHGEIDAKKERKLRAVLKVVEATFDQLGGLDNRIQKFIRLEAVRVLDYGMKHAACCHDNCELAVSSRGNGSIALSVIQTCFEKFVDSSEVTHFAIATIAPETTKATLLQCLDKIKQLKLQHVSTMQRAQANAAVKVVIEWSREQVCTPCGNRDGEVSSSSATDGSLGPVLPLLTLPPPALTPTPLNYSLSSASLASSNSVGSEETQLHYAIRDIILSAARLASVKARVRCAALRGVQDDDGLVEWIRTINNFPVDVLGVVILSAAARKLGEEDLTSHLLETTCKSFKISPTSAREARSSILEVWKVGHDDAGGAFGEGLLF